MATEMRPGASPKSCGYVYTGRGEVSSLVTDPPCNPPLYVKKKRYQKFYICSDAPGQSRVNPERQEEEKSGHKRWVNGQNSAGGEQTDLQNPTTHYRRARGIKGIIRNQWG